MGRPHVHHGHRPRLLQRVARGQVSDEPRGAELQRLLLHVRAHDVHRLHRRHADSVQVRTQSNQLIRVFHNEYVRRYTSYVKPEIPLGNLQNGGPQGKVKHVSCKYLLSISHSWHPDYLITEYLSNYSVFKLMEYIYSFS